MKGIVLMFAGGVCVLLCCAGWEGALAGAWLVLAVVAIGAGVARWFGG